MTTGSAVGTTVRIATAASAIAAAAVFAPATVANAVPRVPAPQASILDSVGACDPSVEVCTAALVGDGLGSLLPQTSFLWIGPANPAFQPLIGIVFPNIFGLDLELCALGGAVHLSPYGSGFVGIGLGC